MSTELILDNINCAACARRVTAAVQRLLPGSEVAVDIGSGRVAIDPALPEPSAELRAALAEALTRAGYPPHATPAPQ